jgi:hypothetical protein
LARFERIHLLLGFLFFCPLLSKWYHIFWNWTKIVWAKIWKYIIPYSTIVTFRIQRIYYDKCRAQISLQTFQLWISSAHNCSGYYCLSSTATDPTPEHFNLSVPNATGSWAKTGYLGFVSLAPKSTLGSKSKSFFNI